jgi:hypothetical protein
VLLGTLDGRGMDVMTVDVALPPAARELRTHTTFGSAWQRRFRQPSMVRVEAPGPGGPIETWIASPPDADDEPLPTIVDVHGGPLGCWAPAPQVTNHRRLPGAAEHPRVVGTGAIDPAPARDWAVSTPTTCAAPTVIALARRPGSRIPGSATAACEAVVVPPRFHLQSENSVTNQVSCWANSDSGPEYCRAAPGDQFRRGRSVPGTVAAARREREPPLLICRPTSAARRTTTSSSSALRHLRWEVEFVLTPTSRT